MTAASPTICAMCGEEIPSGTRVCLNCGERLPIIQDRKKWPFWVRFSLWKIHSRRWAWAWVWVSLALGVFPMLIAAGLSIYLKTWDFVVLGLIVLASAAGGAAAYYFSIRWVDRHDAWTKP